MYTCYQLIATCFYYTDNIDFTRNIIIIMYKILCAYYIAAALNYAHATGLFKAIEQDSVEEVQQQLKVSGVSLLTM